MLKRAPGLETFERFWDADQTLDAPSLPEAFLAALLRKTMENVFWLKNRNIQIEQQRNIQKQDWTILISWLKLHLFDKPTDQNSRVL